MFSGRFELALAFSHRLHRRQKRKTSGVPYIAHPLSVCALVIEYGGTEDEAIAALLHDAIEDAARHYEGGAGRLEEDIRREFGAGVLRIVEACTERQYPEELEAAGEPERWRAHKRGYLAQVLAGGPSARLVSCADALHNVRTLTADWRRTGDRVWTHFRTRSRDDQVWAYSAAAHAFARAGVGDCAAELSRAVDELCAATGAARPKPLQSG